MSITYILRKEGITDSLDIPGPEISAFLLQKLLADKLKAREQDLTLFNIYTGFKITPMETIKDKCSIFVERLRRPYVKTNSVGIIGSEELAEMGTKARFFMIKSANEENIQKARDCSIWATTYSNQDRLRSAFLYCPHVFLIFATNRSTELKGFARMENEPSKTADKACWSGVANIRLGGNFQIRWIRKQPLTCLQIEKSLGAMERDRIMRLSDGEQIDSELAQKVVMLFEVPTQPYYEAKEAEPNHVQHENKIMNLGQIFGKHEPMLLFPAPLGSIAPPKVQSTAISVSFQSKLPFESNSKIKQQSKQKKRKQHSSSSSQSSDSESSSVSSSSSSKSRKKIKKSKDRKKGHKRDRSRDKKKKNKGKKDDRKKDKKRQKKSKRN